MPSKLSIGRPALEEPNQVLYMSLVLSLRPAACEISGRSKSPLLCYTIWASGVVMVRMHWE